MIDEKELKKEAESRSKSFLFFSHFYLKRPDLELLRKIKREEFRNYLRKLSLYFEKFYEHTERYSDEKILDELCVDFTKLMRGIKRTYSLPPPYESVWRGENILMGNFCKEVLNFYLNSGINIIVEDELPDHIGIELKFLSLLSFHEKNAWESSSLNEAKRFLKLQKEFLEKHILTWAFYFLEEVFQKAETYFYKGLSLLTKSLLSETKERIDELLINLKDG
ncbi:MAG: molecular chaperone TorD family protein [Candidatus Omnitrophica bacterium]|nr:molecular chaperone TorD family protein [Candidatus Omnitrophota bacterium]